MLEICLRVAVSEPDVSSPGSLYRAIATTNGPSRTTEKPPPAPVYMIYIWSRETERGGRTGSRRRRGELFCHGIFPPAATGEAMEETENERREVQFA